MPSTPTQTISCPKGHLCVVGQNSVSRCPCGSPRSSSARSAIARPQMTARFPTGSGELSSTNSLERRANSTNGIGFHIRHSRWSPLEQIVDVRTLRESPSRSSDLPDSPLIDQARRAAPDASRAPRLRACGLRPVPCAAHPLRSPTTPPCSPLGRRLIQGDQTSIDIPNPPRSLTLDSADDDRQCHVREMPRHSVGILRPQRVRSVVLKLPGQDRLQLLMLEPTGHGITMSPPNLVGKPRARRIKGGLNDAPGYQRWEGGEGSALPPGAWPPGPRLGRSKRTRTRTVSMSSKDQRAAARLQRCWAPTNHAIPTRHGDLTHHDHPNLGHDFRRQAPQRSPSRP
jgi:hypothetical protein